MNQFRLAIALVLAAPLPALAQPAPPTAAASAFDADRADILGMAGNFKVKFDMQEATSWRADYTPIPVKVSGGFEAVRVIEDTGRIIRLQHLLVVDAGGKPMVIKDGRFGPYVTDGETNASLRKGDSVEEITDDEVIFRNYEGQRFRYKNPAQPPREQPPRETPRPLARLSPPPRTTK